MVRVQARLADHLGIDALALRARRLDGRDAGARVGDHVPAAGALDHPDRHLRAGQRRSRSPGGPSAARRSRSTRAGAAATTTTREPGRRARRGPGDRPHGRPGDVPQRQRVHGALRRAGDGPSLRDGSSCGSGSRWSATSSTTAPSSAAASTPTATWSSARRWTSTTSAAAGAALGGGDGRIRAPSLTIGIIVGHRSTRTTSSARSARCCAPGASRGRVRGDRLAARPRRLPDQPRPARRTDLQASSADRRRPSRRGGRTTVVRDAQDHEVAGGVGRHRFEHVLLATATPAATCRGRRNSVWWVRSRVALAGAPPCRRRRIAPAHLPTPAHRRSMAVDDLRRGEEAAAVLGDPVRFDRVGGLQQAEAMTTGRRRSTARSSWPEHAIRRRADSAGAGGPRGRADSEHRGASGRSAARASSGPTRSSSPPTSTSPCRATSSRGWTSGKVLVLRRPGPSIGLHFG